MSSLKPIGFLQEDFHSETLDFLFEIITNREPDKKLILYNIHDRYNNKSYYKEKYRNLEIRSLNCFIPDMAGNVCEKIIIISYDNIFHLSLLEPYIDQLIFVSHSPKHIKAFEKLNIENFSLSRLLSTNFMIPFVKDISLRKKSRAHIEKKDDHIEKKTQETLDFIKTKKINNDLTIILIVGNFLQNNKDMELLKDLASSGRFLFLIYAPELSEILYNFILENKNYAYTALGLSTEEIRANIQFLDIKYLLFAPPKESQFYTSSWSGSISFAFDNDLHLIMPKQISDYYNITDAIISYDTSQDIISQIESKDVIECKNKLQKIRDYTYSRNVVVWDMMWNRIKTSSLGHYKIEYNEDEKNIEDHVMEYQKIFDSVDNIKNKLSNGSVIDINPDTNIFNITCLLLEPSCNLINFIEDLPRAKYYKNLMMYNNFLDRIKIYNNIIGEKCQGDTVDTFTLDHLDLQNVSLVRMTNTSANNIILGAKKILTEQKPILLIQHQTGTTGTTYDLTEYDYNHIIIGSYHVYY